MQDSLPAGWLAFAGRELNPSGLLRKVSELLHLFPLSWIYPDAMRLEAENAVLRHQLIVLRRRVHGRVRLTNHDRWYRWFFIRLYRWFPSILKVLTIVRPDETLLRWHRAGFRRYWRWKIRVDGEVGHK